MISPISQSNITKSSATSVYNFLNAQVDQRHLPSRLPKQNGSPSSQHSKSEQNGFGASKIKMGLSAFEMEKNLKNSAKSGMENGAQLVENSVEHRSESPENISILEPSRSRSSDNSRVQEDVVEVDKIDNHKSKHNLGKTVGKTSSIFENLSKNHKTAPSWFEPSYKLNKTPNISSSAAIEEPHIEESEQITDNPKQEVESLDVVGPANLKNSVDEEVSKTKVDLVTASESVKSVQSASNKASAVTSEVSDNKPVKIVLPKKPKPRKEEATSAVFNFTARKDVPDYISNDTSRSPSRPVIPKVSYKQDSFLNGP